MLSIEELRSILSLPFPREVQDRNITDQHSIGLFSLIPSVYLPMPSVFCLPIQQEEDHCQYQTHQKEYIHCQQHPCRHRSRNRIGIWIGTPIVHPTRIQIQDLTKILRVKSISCTGSQDEKVEEDGLEDGEEDCNSWWQFELLIVVLDLNATALGSAIADANGFVIHPHPTACTNYRDLTFQVLPESEFRSMAMQHCQSDGGGELKGQTVALDLLSHGLLDETYLDAVGLDDLA